MRFGQVYWGGLPSHLSELSAMTHPSWVALHSIVQSFTELCKPLCHRQWSIKTPESSLDSKEIKSVNFKVDQPWIFTGRTDAKAETRAFWSSDGNRWLTHWKRPWCWERLRAGQEGVRGWVSEDKIAGQHYQCNEHELGQTPGDS